MKKNRNKRDLYAQVAGMTYGFAIGAAVFIKFAITFGFLTFDGAEYLFLTPVAMGLFGTVFVIKAAHEV